MQNNPHAQGHGLPVKPMVLTKERQTAVEAHINRAISALVDAQIEMLIDSPGLFERELSKRLSPALHQAYSFAATAERNAADSFRALNGGER
jgi:hypothetical protein